MVLNHVMRAEFAQLLLTSAVFQQGLATLAGIANQVQAHAPPAEPADAHKFQFGEQWKFAEPQASARFIPATVAAITEHLATAVGLELPEFTDARFMGLGASTLKAVAFTAATGPNILGWRAEALAQIAALAEDLMPLTKTLLASFAPAHIRYHHKLDSHTSRSSSLRLECLGCATPSWPSTCASACQL